MAGKGTWRSLAAAALVACAVALAGTASAAPTLTTDPLILEPVIDPVAQPKFVNPLTDILAPSYVFTPTSGPDPAYDYFYVSMKEFSHTVGLRDDTQAGFPLLNPVKAWGYGDARSDAPTGQTSFPGPTFVRTSTIGPNPGKPIKVVWSNQLPSDPNYHLMGLPHPNMTAIDTTMMCGRNAPTCRPFERVVPHVHGGHTWDYSDGIPEQWFSPAFAVIGTQFWTPPEEQKGTFTYTLDQTMANLWYHDHATGVTRLNVQAGLAGEFLLRDETELNLISSGVIPAYPYEVPLMVQDKTFVWDAATQTPQIAVPDVPLSDPKKIDPATGLPCVQGSLSPACWVLDPVEKKPIPSITPEFFGNMILVNGQTWPFKSVEPRKYRLRLLPATDSRSFFFQLENRATVPPTPVPFLVIGTEQGLLPSPVVTTTLIMQPAERLDVVVDFSNLAGAEIVLRNLGPEGPFSPSVLPVNPATVQPEPPSPPNTTGLVMLFRVDAPLNTAVPNATVDVGTTLTGPIPTLPPAVKERNLVMKETSDQYGRLILKINGLGYLDPTTEIPALDTTEMWDFVNLTPDVHPMHIHLIKFQIVSREDLVQPAIQTVPPTWTPLGTFEPVRPEEMGWKDTIQTYPNQITRVKATYDVPGIYIFHCHILSHEEYDKMRHYAVVMNPAGADLQISSGPSVQPAASAEPVVFHARGLTGLSYPLPPQSHGFEFQFSVKHPVRGWMVVQKFSDASNFIWSPRGSLAGTYLVRVDLRIPTTTAVLASAEIPYILYGEPPKTMTVSPANASLPAGSAGAKVTFTANACPAGNYEYRFRVVDAAQNSTTVQDFSTNIHWTWTPPASAAVYTVAVDARALGSTGNGDITATTTFTVVARAPASVTLSRTGSSQQASASPSPVTFTANPLPAGPYEYRFSVKDPVSGWNAGNYQSANTFTWTPPANRTGLFTIQVEVRPAGSTARPAIAVAGYTLRP